MKSIQAKLLLLCVLIGVFGYLADQEPAPAMKLAVNPIGCYKVSTGRGSKWLPKRFLAPPPITDTTSQRFALMEDERDMLSVLNWGLTFVPDSTKGLGHQASWSRFDSTETRLRFFDVDWGWHMNMFAASAETFVGVATFQSDFVPVNARVKFARISCLTAYKSTPSGLLYHVMRQGGKDSATVGATVTVNTIIRFGNGTELFNGYASKTPITFQIGKGDVVRGIEEGVTGMHVGESRKLIVPPMSAGNRAAYPVSAPSDSTLHVRVELVGVKRQ